MLCQLSAAMPVPCTIVLEPYVVPDVRAPFDFWLKEVGVLVEVDGQQHMEGSYRHTSLHDQVLRDYAKEEAALRAGYHVVRLHWADGSTWCDLVWEAVRQAMYGCMPRIHRSRSYPTVYFFTGT